MAEIRLYPRNAKGWIQDEFKHMEASISADAPNYDVVKEEERMERIYDNLFELENIELQDEERESWDVKRV